MALKPQTRNRLADYADWLDTYPDDLTVKGLRDSIRIALGASGVSKPHRGRRKASATQGTGVAE